MPYLDSFFGILNLDCSQVLDLRRLLECTRRLEAVFVLVFGELFTIDYNAIDMMRQKRIECIVELLCGSRLEESSAQRESVGSTGPGGIVLRSLELGMWGEVL